MEKFRTKMKKQGGFTLIEMLIVVAIIAILIAVSIPLVGTALERARRATDAANERSAKAEALIMYMTNGLIDETDDTSIFERGTWYLYDAVNGRLVDEIGDVEPYGKCRDGDHPHTGHRLWVSIGSGEADGGTADVVYLQWTEDDAPDTYPTNPMENLDSAELVAE